MGKQFDELSKSLASGVSRRTTLKRFATGVTGALLASALPGRVALGDEVANEPAECRATCSEAGFTGAAYRVCSVACTTCVAHGHQFSILNGSNPVCF